LAVIFHLSVVWIAICLALALAVGGGGVSSVDILQVQGLSAEW
jgi:hypothetical protein